MIEIIRESYRAEQSMLFRGMTLGRFSSETMMENPFGETNRRDPVEIWWQSYLRGFVPITKSVISHEVRIVDLFSGCGGLTLGVTEAIRAAGLGFRVLAAADIDAAAIEIYKSNFIPDLAMVQNVNAMIDFQVNGREDDAEFSYDPEILEPSLAGRKGEVDLLLAGPPCQGHSNLNNRTRGEDPRNLLYLSVVAAAVALDAKAVVIENVPDVVKDKRGFVKTAKALFGKAGYQVTEGILKAYELGCAQTRRRHFLIACRRLPISLIAVSEALKKPPVTMEWAIGDLLDKAAVSIFDTVSNLSPENQKRIDYLFENEIYELPNEMRPDCHKNGHTYPSIYGRLKWDQPSHTITTGFMTPGRGRFIHPLRRRILTPHEAARLQGFPDSFRFTTDANPNPFKRALSKWIGDAVPPPMGYAAGACAIVGLSYIQNSLL